MCATLISDAHIKGAACLVASAFGFALMAFCVRLCDECGAPISSFEKSFFRNLIALAIALVVFCRARSTEQIGWHLRPASWGLLLLRASLGTVGIFANFYALSHIPIAVGQTLNKTAPFFTVVFAWIFLGERARMRHFFTLALAFSGVWLIARPNGTGVTLFPLAIGLLGGVCAGGAYACVRMLRTQAVSSPVIVLFFSAFSCLASVPFMLMHFDPLTLVQFLVLLGAGVGAAIGQFGVTLAYGYAAPREIAVFDYTNILFTAAFGFFFFDQIPDIWAALGFLIILAAVFHLHR